MVIIHGFFVKSKCLPKFKLHVPLLKRPMLRVLDRRPDSSVFSLYMKGQLSEHKASFPYIHM